MAAWQPEHVKETAAAYKIPPAIICASNLDDVHVNESCDGHSQSTSSCFHLCFNIRLNIGGTLYLPMNKELVLFNPGSKQHSKMTHWCCKIPSARPVTSFPGSAFDQRDAHYINNFTAITSI
jgi:hypothetical protein